MKKLLFTIITLFIIINTNAQTQKGKIVVSGGTSMMFNNSNIKYKYDGVTDEKVETDNYSFLPSVGYFAVDNLSIDLNLGYIYQKNKNSDNINVTDHQFIIGIGASYYLLKDNVKPFFSIGCGYVNYKQENEIYNHGEEDEQYDGLNVNFGGGVAFFIRNNISLNVGVGYSLNYLTNTDDDNLKIDKKDLSALAGLSIYF